MIYDLTELHHKRQQAGLTEPSPSMRKIIMRTAKQEEAVELLKGMS
jgi:hypothetical protein